LQGLVGFFFIGLELEFFNFFFVFGLVSDYANEEGDCSRFVEVFGFFGVLDYICEVYGVFWVDSGFLSHVFLLVFVVCLFLVRFCVFLVRWVDRSIWNKEELAKEICVLGASSY